MNPKMERIHTDFHGQLQPVGDRLPDIIALRWFFDVTSIN